MEALEPRRRQGGVTSGLGGGAVLYLLMLSRLWDVASSHRRGLISERTLRMAGASLAGAGSAEEVAGAVQRAATILSAATVLAAASVGVATSRDSADSDEVLSHADLALYAAKAAGKRRWQRYTPGLSARMLRRREVQSALEDAVNNSEFTLAYQPIAALASGEIAGLEALVRWPHPRWGMMQPSQFIGLAEETGQIVPLGVWVLRQALADMVTWRDRLAIPPDGRPYISVNVSARQFRDPGFVDGVRQALLASGLPPSALLLELTESVAGGGSDRIHADLRELKDIGVRLAIDDFGTGYSSLGYLLELPFDVLKIDKTFVTGIAASWRRHALVEGIAACRDARGGCDRRGDRERDRAAAAGRHGHQVRPGLPAVGPG